ncbi:MAG: FG-GAP-like repeat-containing protein [Saprospiraceae bacterium]
MKQIFLSLLLLGMMPNVHAQVQFTKVIDPDNPATTFNNVGGAYKGVGWIDLDDDNYTDLFVNPHFLFRNLGNGNFEQLENLAGAGTTGASGVSWGDLNNDGFPDVITSSAQAAIHLNNGDQTFDANAITLPGFGTYAAWDCALVDADNNGLLDVLYVHARNFHPIGPFPCKFYLQTSPGVYTAVTGYEFTDTIAPYTIPVWADFDLDGDMDLFIGSGPAGVQGPDYCYKNELIETGSFSLTRLTDAPFDQLQDGQTYNFPDVDNDGDLDICLTNYNGAKNRYWIQEPAGVYTLTQAPFSLIGGHLSNVWGDVDNDGDLDMLLSSDGNTLVRLYKNNGDGSFEPPKQAGFSDAGVCAIALADYDNDGDLDFYTNGIGSSRALFRNDDLAENRNWAAFKLQGTVSNRSAIGATLRLKADLGAGSVWQVRQVTAHNTFGGHSDLRQHFGLNLATTIDSVVVRWPSGLMEYFTDLNPNNFYKLVEGNGISIITKAEAPIQKTEVRVYPNPTSGVLLIETENTPPGKWKIFDLTGNLVQEGSGSKADVSQLPAGKYIIQLGGEKRVVPFIKI